MNWEPTALRGLFGEPVRDGMSPAAFQRLVDGAVAETDQLDFKGAWYRFSDPKAGDDQKDEAAKDVAALANHRGGALIIGVVEDKASGVAKKLVPRSLTDRDWRIFAQTVAQRTTPPVEYRVFVVPAEDSEAEGFGVILVPPGRVAPHALLVRASEGAVRYPIRYHTTTRWMSESEIADRYRQRSTAHAERPERLESIAQQGVRRLGGTNTWIWVALTPEVRGLWPLDASAVAAADAWLGANRLVAWTGAEPYRGPRIRVGARHVEAAGGYDNNGRINTSAVLLHDDGSVFAAREVFREPDQRGVVTIGDELLATLVLVLLRTAIAHSTENAGAWGPGLAKAGLLEDRQLSGTRLQLERPNKVLYNHDTGPVRAPGAWKAEPVSIDLEAAVGSTTGLLAATRSVLAEIFQSYGLAEVRQVTPNGSLRRTTSGQPQQLVAWANQHGVPVLDDDITIQFPL